MTSPFNTSEIPGMASMNDSLSFVKNLWGGMHIPGMVTPTVSIDDLDKKIKDLKTVESWLTVNMNMLRGTIQALEVQRATIAALNSLSESFANTMSAASASSSSPASSSTSSPEAAKPTRDYWPNPPADSGNNKGSSEAAPIFTPTPPPVVSTRLPASAPLPDPIPNTPAQHATAEDAAGADSSTRFSNPAAWWNLLQDQFKQAVSKAMASEPEEPTPEKAAKKATSTSSKSAPKNSVKKAPEKAAAAAAATTPTAAAKKIKVVKTSAKTKPGTATNTAVHKAASQSPIKTTVVKKATVAAKKRTST
ncbi:hypothetical protein AAKU64_002460 [Undibacterium sp. GrIS 1.8]|uniref:PhaM family polyhydroxyalkanoate granule multifunctional regulatory protein n=1 Tax=unclassified Undibacterium TaxID=2630295 RepID=UPI003390A2DC